MPADRLKGRRILITGAASGIGRRTAELFAAEGAALTLLDCDRKRLAEAARETGGVAAEADVTQEASVAHAVEQGAAAMGGIDGVVNAAGKGGIVNLTRALAAELAPSIRVNSVCPGMVDTPMTAGLQREVDRYALKRVAEPLEIAQAILFLTSTESSFITGA